MTIVKLPPHIISRISAGEVVERPTNIVKELVENAIDAESSKITIQLDKGGLELVRVQDNGGGIGERELELAFQLHTTSKIIDEDILNVPTLGFRGEALASISAVAHVEARSRLRDTDQGCRLVIEGGNKQIFEPCNTREGTSISVTGLFFNTPARRKFLKKASTERKKISNLLSSYMLMYPQIHFLLEEKNDKGIFKTKLESPSRKGMMAAVYDVLGKDVAADLLPISGKFADWDINGFVSKPILTRKDRSLQFLCVNGRPINHKDMQESIEKSYGSQLMRNAHPVIILNISGPVNGVDFNIHPQKMEIRFRADDTIISEVANLVGKSLFDTWELPKLGHKKLDKLHVNDNKPVATDRIVGQLPRMNIRGKKEIRLQTSLRDDIKPFVREKVETQKSRKVSSDFLQNENTDQTIIDGKRVLGHVMKKFAVIDAQNEIWLMDVHAADERVKFEMYEKRQNKQILSQQFLEALEISMIPMEKQMVLDHRDMLEKFGMKITDGASDKILIYSTPIFYDRKITDKTVKEMLHSFYEVMEQGEDMIVETVFDRIEYKLVANLACHGSIRSGYHVTNDKIAKVLENLLKCNNPWVCAHGRPTILRMDVTNLEYWFKR